MTQVFVANHPTEAHLVKGMLEAAGVAAEVRGERLFGARGEVPVTPDTLPTVWVEDADATQARTLLADFERTESPPSPAGDSWTCAACGELVEPQFSACWRCGTPQTPPS